MYAIVEVGGHQWKVEPGTWLDINRVPTAVGAQHTVDHVLFAHDGQQAQAGRPYIDGAKVVCEVVDHHLGPKEISYHYRRRENWRKTVGHRQPLSRLVVKTIVCGGMTAGEASVKAEPAPAEKKTAKSTPKKVEKPVIQKTSAVKRQAKTLFTSRPRTTPKA